MHEKNKNTVRLYDKNYKKGYKLEVGMTQLYGIDYAVYENEISKIVSLIAQ